MVLILAVPDLLPIKNITSNTNNNYYLMNVTKSKEKRIEKSGMKQKRNWGLKLKIKKVWMVLISSYGASSPNDYEITSSIANK